MILRKPYAFLIKHFRFIHVLFALLAMYLFLRGNTILNFLENYISSNGMIIESYMLKELFPFLLTLAFFVMIVLNVVMIWLLFVKKKKYFFYIINLGIYIALAILFYYSYTVISGLQISLVDARVIRALRDFYLIVSAVQIVSTFMYAFRATGFDIKKFDFGKDLVELDVAETDNEEFEFEVNVDVNKIHRDTRKYLRHLKYFYYENKLVSNCIIGIFSFVFVLALISLFHSDTQKYSVNQPFTVNNYVVKIGNAYLTNQDKDGQTIHSSKKYVLLEVYIKKTSSKQMKLNLARFELLVGNHKYYHNYSLADYFSDVGDSYYDEELTKDFQKFLLTYEIPARNANKKIRLNYVDENHDVLVNFNLQDLSKTSNEGVFSSGDTVDFSSSFLGGYKLTLSNFAIQKVFTINYTYNSTPLKEYVKPTISTNYNKALLRVKATMESPEFANSKASTFEQLCSNFGGIKYVIDGKTYYHSLSFGMVKPLKVSLPDTYYIEVKEEVLEADNVSLLFKIRNKTYEYVIK